MTTPRLPRFAWSANPLQGGDACGPVKPVPQRLWTLASQQGVRASEEQK